MILTMTIHRDGKPQDVQVQILDGEIVREFQAELTPEERAFAIRLAEAQLEKETQ